MAALLASACYFPSLGPPLPCSPARMCAGVRSVPSDRCTAPGAGGRGILLQAVNYNKTRDLLVTFDDRVIHADGSSSDQQSKIKVAPGGTSDLGCQLASSSGAIEQHQFQPVSACFAEHDPACAGLVPLEPSPSIADCRRKCDADRCVEYPTKRAAVIRLAWAKAVPIMKQSVGKVIHGKPPFKIALDQIVGGVCPHRGEVSFGTDGRFEAYGDSCVGTAALDVQRYNTLAVTADPAIRGTYTRAKNSARLRWDGSNPDQGGIWLQWFGAAAGGVFSDGIQGVSEIDVTDSQIKVIGAQRCIWLDLIP